jgi:hypothetical protein
MEVLDKIKKLLVLGEKNTNGATEEANTALEKAYALMEKYNVTISDINSNDREKEFGKLENNAYLEKQFKVWEKVLLKNISILFDCDTVYEHVSTSKLKREVHILGREGNVRTVQIMFEWIVKKSREEAKALYGSRAVAKINDYCLGVAYSIAEKVNQIKKQNENKEWALVVADETKNFVRSCYPRLTTLSNKTKSNINASCYSAGLSAGRNINLNKQFGLKCIGGV